MTDSHKKKVAITKSLLETIQVELNTDILVECFVELLIHGNLWNLDDIHIIPTENFKRNYRSNVIDIVSHEDFNTVRHVIEREKKLYPERNFEDDTRTLIKIFVSHNSLLDYLPETFYIEPYEEQKESSNESKEEYIKRKKETRKQKEEKLHSAIRFFRPLDIEYYRARVVKELKEITLQNNLEGFLEDIWNVIYLPETLSPLWNRFLKSLHLVMYIVGDAQKTKHLIEFVLNREVELNFSVEDRVELPQKKGRSMDQLQLGHNLSVGNQIYLYSLTCTIQIKNIKKERFYEYFNTSTTTSRLLKEIAKYYFPLDTDVQYEFELEKSQDQFTLGEQGSTAILGYFARI